MTDEHKDPIVGAAPDDDAQDKAGTPVIDSWASAFEALEEPAAPGDEPDQAGGTADAAAAAAGAPAVPGDTELDAGAAGRSLPADGEPGDADGAGAGESVDEVLKRYASEAEETALQDTAKLFLERVDAQGNKLIRQTNGQLGATINDPDIYRIGEDGSAQFYNPDTGKPFTGDNPRAQAKAWVEEYNDELRDTFNEWAAKRQAEIEQQMAPVVEALKFAPTYDALDPVRQKMLDALIEDYEVTDSNGDVIGYSVDLSKALAQVNKQVEAIKAQQSATVQGTPPVQEASGPALDMRASGGGGAGSAKPEFKSLAEAMAWEQDQELAKLKK